MMSVSRNSSGLSSPFLKDARAWIFHVSVCPDAAIPNTVHEVHDLLLTGIGELSILRRAGSWSVLHRT